uniref:Uncharacterized protein n=1 Tax=Parastrongyloides trichosuri TaxID=131310 RepID=A0A0N4ZHE8_PARTI
MKCINAKIISFFSIFIFTIGFVNSSELNNAKNNIESSGIVYKNASQDSSSVNNKYINFTSKTSIEDNHEILFNRHWEEKFSMYFSLFTILFILLVVWLAFTYTQFSQEYYYYRLFKRAKIEERVNI